MWQKYLRDSRIEFACFSFHVGLLFYQLFQGPVESESNVMKLRCFISKDPVILSWTFVTYVWPVLKYCSPVWSPCSTTVINKLERVQRVFTKRLYGMATMSYDDRLKLLGLDRLKLRRLHADLTTCYKIIKNKQYCCGTFWLPFTFYLCSEYQYSLSST